MQKKLSNIEPIGRIVRGILGAACILLFLFIEISYPELDNLIPATFVFLGVLFLLEAASSVCVMHAAAGTYEKTPYKAKGKVPKGQEKEYKRHATVQIALSLLVALIIYFLS